MRILDSVGFDSIFDIRESLPDQEQVMSELPCIEGSDEEVRARVLAAHQLLMELNEKNRDSFRDLVQMLEGA